MDWHIAFGHLNLRDLLRVLKLHKLNIDGPTPKQLDCTACKLGKSTMQTYSLSKRITSRIGEVIAADAFGPVPAQYASPNGNLYFLVILDYFSNHRWVYPLATLTGADRIIVDFLKMVETHCGRRAGAFHSDQGIATNLIKDFCRENGIKREVTSTDCHEQNSRVERFMRTAMDAARTMNVQSGLGAERWDDAVMNFTYTTNLTSITSDNKSPHELWYSNPPDLTHLHRYGEPCFVHYVNAHKHPKPHARASTGTFLGYSTEKNEYIILDPSGDVYGSAHVDFHRNVNWPDPIISRFDEPTVRDQAETDDPRDTDYFPEDAELSESIPPTSSPEPEFFEAESDLNSDATSDYFDPVGDADVPTTLRSPSISQTSNFFLQEVTPANTTPVSRSNISSENILTTSRRSKTQLSTNANRASLVKKSKNIQVADQPQSTNNIAGKQRRRKAKRSRQAVAIAEKEFVDNFWKRQSSISHRAIASMGRALQTVEPPRSFKSIAGRPDEDIWNAATKKEMDGLWERNYGTLVHPSEAKGHFVYPTKWVLTNKSSGAAKARQVVLGNLQSDEDAPNTWAPTPTAPSFKVFVALATHEDLTIRHFDVNQAFLQADIDGVIFIRQAEGFAAKGKENWVIRLNKSLYGLRQAPFLWNKEVDGYLISEGFSSSPADPCVYIKHTRKGKIILLLHVDDFAAAATDDGELRLFFNKLNKKYGVRDEGELKRFLSYQVSRDRKKKTTTLHQQDYIVELLKMANMPDCAPANNPGDLFKTLSAADCPQTPEETAAMAKVPFREVMGCINQLACTTRPELTHHVSNLSRFLNNPGPKHWLAAKQILRYLKATPTLGLVYDGNSQQLTLRGWVDATLASCRDTAHSVGAYFFNLGSAPVAWKGKYLSSVHPSSTQSEIASLYLATSEAIWLRKLLAHLGYQQASATFIYEDNQGAIKWSNIGDRAGRMKHIDVQFFFIREQINNNNIKLKYIKSQDNPADSLTKSNIGAKFIAHREALGVRDFQSLAVRECGCG